MIPRRPVLPSPKKRELLPGAFTAALRRVLPGLSVTRGLFPPLGDPALVVANPHPDGLPILVRLKTPSFVRFGDCVAPRTGEAFGHWREIVDVVRKIVDGTLKGCKFATADGRIAWYDFCDATVTPLGTFYGAFSAFLRQERDHFGALTSRAAFAGAVLDIFEWDPARNVRVPLPPEWFQALALPTALDYLLASVEAPNPPGDNVLNSFDFPFDGASYVCSNYGAHWLLRFDSWEARNSFPLLSVPSLDALLSSTMPSSDPPVAIRDILAALPAHKLAIFRTDDTPLFPPCWIVETPLDARGICGLVDDRAWCPDRFRSVTLRSGETSILEHLVGLSFSRLTDTGPQRPVVIPAPFVPSALDLLREISLPPPPKRRFDRYDDKTRGVAEKLRPVFESAAALGMPVSIRPFRFAPPPPP